MTRTKGPKAGFTLIEMMVVIVIFAIILMAVNLLYLSGTRVYRHSVGMAQMRYQTQRAVMEMSRDMIDCRILDGTQLLDQINLQKPTPKQNQFGELRYVSPSTNQPFWGDGQIEVDGSGEVHEGNTIRYEFQPVAMLNEAADRIDYNDDGDQADAFEEGRIVRTVRDPANTVLETRFLTAPTVFRPVLPAPPLPGNPTVMDLAAMNIDIENDGEADPVFLIVDNFGGPSATGLRIQLKVYNMTMINGRAMLVRSETVVTPVN